MKVGDFVLAKFSESDIEPAKIVQVLVGEDGELKHFYNVQLFGVTRHSYQMHERELTVLTDEEAMLYKLESL